MIDYSLPLGTLSAIIVSFLLPIIHLLILRISSIKEGHKQIKLYFIISIAISIISFFIIKYYLGIYFLDDYKKNYGSYYDEINSILILLFSLIGYIEFYSIIRRGYSLRIMCELYYSGHPMTLKQLMDEYSDGKGIDWLLKKRLDGMVNIGLITLENNKIKLTKVFGNIVALLAILATRILGFKSLG